MALLLLLPGATPNCARRMAHRARAQTKTSGERNGEQKQQQQKAAKLRCQKQKHETGGADSGRTPFCKNLYVTRAADGLCRPNRTRAAASGEARPLRWRAGLVGCRVVCCSPPGPAFRHASAAGKVSLVHTHTHTHTHTRHRTLHKRGAALRARAINQGSCFLGRPSCMRFCVLLLRLLCTAVCPSDKLYTHIQRDTARVIWNKFVKPFLRTHLRLRRRSCPSKYKTSRPRARLSMRIIFHLYICVCVCVCMCVCACFCVIGASLLRVCALLLLCFLPSTIFRFA